MDLYIKLIVICVLGSILYLLVKKNSPELAYLIIIASVLACLFTGLEIVSRLRLIIGEMALFTYISMDLLMPLLKCLGVSIITQIGGSLCKDAGQAAAAYGIELTGNLVMILCSMGLIIELFTVFEGLV